MDDVVDPSYGQSLNEIESFLRKATEATTVAIRNTQGGILVFHLAEVTGSNPRSGRLYTDKAGGWGGSAWYMKSGKNCRHPSGQSRLFIPTPEVRSFLEKNPTGVLCYNTHTPE